MTGYLGFDRGAVGQLVLVLAQLDTEADGVRSADPLVVPSLRTYQRAAQRLANWRSRVELVGSCDVFSLYAPTRLDPLDLAGVDALGPGASAAGWGLAVDPMAAGLVDPVQHAAQIGTFLAQADLGALLADEDRAGAVRAELVALAGPGSEQARHALLAALGPRGFAFVAQDLAALVSRTGLSADASRSAEDARALLAGLATAFGAAVHDGAIDATAYEDALAERPPGAVAGVLGPAHLPAEAAVRLARAAWLAWAERVGVAADPCVPFLLSDALASDAATARLALQTWPPDQLERLLGADTDTDTVERLLLASTADGTVNPDAVGFSMVAVIRFVDEHRGWARDHGLLPALGRYVAPYVENVVHVPGSDWNRSDHWPWGATNGGSVVRYLSQDLEAVGALVMAANALVAVRTAQYFDGAEHGRDLSANLRHLFEVVEPITTGQADWALAHARDANGNWSGLWSVLSFGLGQLPRMVGSIAPKATDPLSSMLSDHGWLGAPPAMSEATTAAQVANDQAHVRQLALVGAVAFAFLTGNHLLSQDTPPPPLWSANPKDYLAALEDWANEGDDQDAVTTRRRVRDAVLAADAGACNDLQSCASR